MTLRISYLWNSLNKALTIINLILFGILTFNYVPYREIKDKEVPVIANILLLLFLGLGAFAALYKLL